MVQLEGRNLSWAIWAAAGLALITFGFNQTALGNLVRIPSFYEQFPPIDVVTSKGAQKAHRAKIEGTVVALYTLFGTFGALGCAPLGDVLGRKKTIWIACLLEIIAYVLMATSYTLAQLIVARTILGLGTGALIATVSVWQAELSKARSRGAHVSAFGIFAGLGGILALWMEYGMFSYRSSVSWRLPLAFAGVFSLAVAGFLCFLPESPHWLIKVGRSAEAEAILHRLSSRDKDEQQREEVGRQKASEIEEATQSRENAKLSALFKMGPRRVFHRFCLACGVQFFLQLNGTNAVVYYATTIFQVEMGYSGNMAYILSACLSFAIAAAAIICSFTVDRFGRRRLMIFGAIMNCICMACLAGTTSNPNNKAALKAGVFFLFAFKFFFTIGWLGLPFLYASEIAPDGLRASICGLSTATSWIFNFVIAEVSPIGFENIGYRYFIVFAVTNATSVIVVYFFYPETAGRTLEEIDAIFLNSRTIFDPVRVAKTLPPRSGREAVLEEMRADIGEKTATSDHAETAESA